MILGIIGAMDCETKETVEAMVISERVELCKMNFYIGTLDGVKLAVVCSGIGKVNAAVATQLLIDKFGCNYVINVGVAGGVEKSLNIGDFVISSDTVYHDFIIPESTVDIPWLPNTPIKADPYLIEKSKATCAKVETIKEYYEGRVVSGDQFINNTEDLENIRERLSPHCIEMEGASVGHVCFLNNIPFVVIRSISDKADEEATISFTSFLEIATKQLGDFVKAFVREMI